MLDNFTRSKNQHQKKVKINHKNRKFVLKLIDLLNQQTMPRWDENRNAVKITLGFLIVWAVRS